MKDCKYYAVEADCYWCVHLMQGGYFVASVATSILTKEDAEAIAKVYNGEIVR